MGLGGNLGDVRDTFRRALSSLHSLPGTRVRCLSGLYRNPPMGGLEQPHYLNAVAELETELAPRALLAELMRIETAEGRVRDGARWQSRPLDLDLLLHGGERIQEPSLTLPHPGAHLRPFVIHPLAEIAPQARIPGLGPVAELAAGVDDGDLERVAPLAWSPG